jgi:hypothetical protein
VSATTEGRGAAGSEGPAGASRGAGLRRLLLAAGGATLVVFGLAAFAHTPAGRPLLGLLGRCPVALPGTLPAAEREAGRSAAIRTFRGATPAEARPALQFVVGKTTRAEVAAWATGNGVSCLLERSGATLTCARVPLALLPQPYRGAALDEMTLRFDPSDRLVALVTRRSGLDADAARATQQAIAADLEARVGKPYLSVGDPSSLAGSSALAQIRTEFRFSDYYASAVASRMGKSITVYEEYMLIPN